MIEDHPNTPYERKPSGQLVLPPVNEAPNIEDMETRREATAFASPSSSAYQPAHRSVALTPRKPIARMLYFWNADPAYKVLIVAIAMVLVAATIFIALLANTFTAMMSHVHSQPTVLAQNMPTASPTSVGADSAQPTFPPPGGGQGTTQSSQLPATTAQATVPPPSAAPTRTISAPNSSAPLAIWITSIPPQVSNNSDVLVTITTNQPGLAVRLMVSYNVSPYFYYSQQQTTDKSCTASLTWSVQLHFFTTNNSTATAHVIAIASDKKGHQARSQSVTVRITDDGNNPDPGLLQ